MWAMMQQPKAADYVLAKSLGARIRRAGFCRGRPPRSLARAGADEVGIEESSGEEVVKVDPRYFRPTEVNALLGDPSKARARLGWKHKVTFDDLVTEMVTEDLQALRP